MIYETSFSDPERALFQRVADERGIPWEQVVSELTSEAIAQFIRLRLGRRGAAQVLALPTRSR